MQTQQLAPHTITESEVAEWWGELKKLSNAEYAAIAAKLNRMCWPGDPPPPPDVPWLPKVSEAEPDRYWDFEGAQLAGQTILDSLPNMKAHWNGLRWDPITRDGYDAICALEAALHDAMPFIEFPFGKYKKRKGSPKTPKAWHSASITIANAIITTLIAAGRPVGGITRNSVIVRVVHKALSRIGYPDSNMRTLPAIGAHLSRWHKRYGLMHLEINDDHKAAEIAL